MVLAKKAAELWRKDIILIPIPEVQLKLIKRAAKECAAILAKPRSHEKKPNTNLKRAPINEAMEKYLKIIVKWNDGVGKGISVLVWNLGEIKGDMKNSIWYR